MMQDAYDDHDDDNYDVVNNYSEKAYSALQDVAFKRSRRF